MLQEKHFGPVWVIPGENEGKYPCCHSLYIQDAGVLIDPSSNRSRLKELRRNNNVRQVWLSHWHEDHFMHLDLFDDLPLFMMEQDAEQLSDLELFLEAYGLEDTYKKEWRPLLKDVFHFTPRKPDGFLEDGTWQNLRSTRVKIIHTPGHTPGHTAFLFDEPGLLFLGDYDLTKFGPWYGDPGSNIQQTIDSVNKLKKIQAKVWVTSHETGIFESPPGQLWDNYLDVIRIREEKLLDVLVEPKTFEQIVAACIIYRKPREPKHFFEFGEKAHMKKHLEKLMTENRVTFYDDRYHLNL